MATHARADIEYPERDGLPMSDNTLQFQWIVVIKENLEALFRDRPDVFVAGDLLWYPVEGDNVTRAAPDAMVVFGRPKGHRGSYRQWEEDGLAPQVVFEVLSPGNRAAEMARKLEFYERHGVEEYYVYDPDNVRLTGRRREGRRLVEIPAMNGWVSPRLGIRFDLGGPELQIFGPDGKPFLTFTEVVELREIAEAEARLADAKARSAARKAQAAKRRAERAETRAELAEAEAAKEKARAERLAQRLRELGLDPEG